ncbi:MAG TPA: rod shape-determining protein MreC [Terriglobales bacterium]|nr:rod shape-determining protein MreC [Terriglobales bacterium]
MENVISRFRNTLNLIVLMAVLLAQVLGLAIQVKRPDDGGTRLIRVWTIGLITPITRGIIHTEDWIADEWHSYVWLRNVRKENEELKDQIVQMKMDQVRLIEDANQARRLQLLLGFKEQYISGTVPAQVISTTGSEFSRAIYIDKGTNDGVKPDMPVVAPEGIVGKVLRAFPTTSLVLLINDPTSGAGVILEKSRLQGILKGAPNGSTVMQNVMADEKVGPGERILTSGGDRIFPKGLPVGTVAAVSPGQDLFLNIRVRPAATLNTLEEVLVITKIDEHAPDGVTGNEPSRRAIDILAQRLPTVAPPAPIESVPGTGAEAASGKPSPELTKPAGTAIAPTTTKPKATDVSGGATTKPTTPAGTTDKPKPVKQAEVVPASKPSTATPNPTGTTKDTQPQ